MREVRVQAEHQKGTGKPPKISLTKEEIQQEHELQNKVCDWSSGLVWSGLVWTWSGPVRFGLVNKMLTDLMVIMSYCILLCLCLCQCHGWGSMYSVSSWKYDFWGSWGWGIKGTPKGLLGPKKIRNGFKIVLSQEQKPDGSKTCLANKPLSQVIQTFNYLISIFWDEGPTIIFHQLVVCLYSLDIFDALHKQFLSFINEFSLVRALCSRDETESSKQKSAFDQRSKQIHFSGGWRSTEKKTSIHLFWSPATPGCREIHSETKSRAFVQ